MGSKLYDWRGKVGEWRGICPPSISVKKGPVSLHDTDGIHPSSDGIPHRIDGFPDGTDGIHHSTDGVPQNWTYPIVLNTRQQWTDGILHKTHGVPKSTEHPQA